jgi:hypothetical protein
LNGLALFLLLRASLEVGPRSESRALTLQEILPPQRDAERN